MQNIIYDRSGRSDKILINDDTARTIYNSCADDCEPGDDEWARVGRRGISPSPHLLTERFRSFCMSVDMEKKRGWDFVLYCWVTNPSSSGN